MRPEVALAVILFIVGTPLLIWRDARRRHKRLLSSVRRRFGHPGDGKYRFSTLSSYSFLHSIYCRNTGFFVVP